MRYIVTHTTRYKYSSPVSVCHNVLMLEPSPSNRLSCKDYHLEIMPKPKTTYRRTDMFGNVIQRFSLEENHDELQIKSVSHVTINHQEPHDSATAPTCQQVIEQSRQHTNPDWLKVSPFFFDSPRIRRSEGFRDYANQSIAADRSIITAVMDLTTRIYKDFKYDSDATMVDTPTEAAFAGRHGVCQDFAHVAVACLRSVGLPARYVSGYLRTKPPEGKERLIGADESHAWFSVYCGSQLGWIDFDPTNNCLCNLDHVPIAFGRDYSDVVPVKGIFLGGGETRLSVSVDVAPNEDEASAVSAPVPPLPVTTTPET